MRALLTLLLLLPFAASAQNYALVPQSSLVLEGSHVFCQGTCKLYSASITTGGVGGFFMIFDAPSDPPNGALVQPVPGARQAAPKYCFPFPANFGQGYSWSGLGAPNNGALFQTGLVLVFSVGADCMHKTESATANFTVQTQ